MTEEQTPAEEAGETSRYPFKLGGQEFATIDRIPKWAMMRLASGYRSKNDVAVMGAMYDFLQAIIIPKEWERLEEYLDAHDDEVDDIDDAIGTWMSTVTDRPKETPSPSHSGPTAPTEQAPSRVVSLSPAGLPPHEGTSSTG